MSNLVSELKEFVRDQFRGLNTTSVVIVEEVDEDRRRVTVSMKDDTDVLVDNVPIASISARDGAGLIVPVERGDEGVMLHAKKPLEKQIQQRGEVTPDTTRRFQIENGVFFPMIWLDEDDVPDHEPGEYHLSHGGTDVRVTAEGDVAVEHDSGAVLRVDGDGVHIEGQLFIDGEPYDEHTHGYDWEDEAGSGTTEPPG